MLFHYFRCHPTWRPHKCLPLLPRFMMSTHAKIGKIGVSMFVHKNVTSFNISMNLALLVKIQKSLNHFFHYGCDQNFVLDSIFELGADDVVNGTSAEEWHYEPKIGIVDKWYIITNDIFVATLRHNLDFFSNIIHITILKELQINNFDCYF